MKISEAPARAGAFARTKARSAQHAFTSKAAFKAWIEAPSSTLDVHGRASHSDGDARWSNEDLDPTPPSKRTWAFSNYVSFYWALSFGNWTLGSTMVGLGLNWWEAIIVIFASQLISSVAMFFNSRCASAYHIGYPVVARSVFGMWGSFYVVAARACLAIVWYGIQLFSGSAFVSVMLRCVFGRLYEDIPNTIPASMGITTAGMLSFFLFWCVHFPFCALRPYQMKWFFWFKTAVMVPSILGLFIFCLADTKGNIGSVYSGSITGNKAWYILQAINAGMGNTVGHSFIFKQPLWLACKLTYYHRRPLSQTSPTLRGGARPRREPCGHSSSQILSLSPSLLPSESWPPQHSTTLGISRCGTPGTCLTPSWTITSQVEPGLSSSCAPSAGCSPFWVPTLPPT